MNKKKTRKLQDISHKFKNIKEHKIRKYITGNSIVSDEQYKEIYDIIEKLSEHAHVCIFEESMELFKGITRKQYRWIKEQTKEGYDKEIYTVDGDIEFLDYIISNIFPPCVDFLWEAYDD